MELGRDLNTKVMYTFNVGKNDIHVPRASSDFDGDFAPEFGTQHSPANYVSRYARWSPIVLKIGLKDAAPEAASFEPMYVWFGLHLA